LKYSEKKNSPIVTFFTKIPTWTGLEKQVSLLGERATTHSLRNVAVFWLLG